MSFQEQGFDKALSLGLFSGSKGRGLWGGRPGGCLGRGPGSAVDAAHHHLVSSVAEAASGGLLGVGIAGIVLQLAVTGGHLGVQAVGEVMQDTHAVLHRLGARTECLSTVPTDFQTYPEYSEWPVPLSVWKDLTGTPWELDVIPASVTSWLSVSV